MDELDLRELEIILLFELSLRRKDALSFVDLEGFRKCEVCLCEDMLDEEEVFCGGVDRVGRK